MDPILKSIQVKLLAAGLQHPEAYTTTCAGMGG